MNAYRSVCGLILLCNAARRPEAGGHPQCSDLLAVQPNCMRLVVEPGSAHMRSRRVLEQVFLDCIAVEPAIVHSRRAIVRPSPACGLRVTAQVLDVDAARGKHVQPGSASLHHASR